MKEAAKPELPDAVEVKDNRSAKRIGHSAPLRYIMARSHPP